MEITTDPVFEFHAKICELFNEITSYDNRKDRRRRIRQYLQKFDTDSAVLLPDFAPDWPWFNVTSPLSLSGSLRGKVLVLDFFTYCCINCMHILPDLAALEHAYSDTDGVVIVGVHSAKFDNERVSENVLSAVLRYDITHPVVNDTAAALWTKLQIKCWPTLAVVSPAGHLLLLLTGEGHRELLLDFVGEAVTHYNAQISRSPVGISLAKHAQPQHTLRFPGKLCVNSDASRLAIADTGHHRIVITDNNGIIQDIIGGAEPGNRDGCYNFAQFRSPQGVCYHGDSVLFVADTENHTIRKIDLVSQSVVTVAGTGSQGHDDKGGGRGTDQPISSPWDLAIAPDNPSILYIAMAGTHQIWTLYLSDGEGLKGVQHTAGTCIVFAGSGAEENRNNSYPHRAGFAQPSGLAVARVPDDAAHCSLFVADSESSTIRNVSLRDGGVKGVVGGSIDPTDLFAFGDEDGKASRARLQHPLGVAVLTGAVMVADSYNHKIKAVNPLTRSCSTLVGSGRPGHSSGLTTDSARSLVNEPGGLAAHPNGTTLYIADTNNHCVKVLNINTREMSQLPVIASAPRDHVDRPAKPLRHAPATAVHVTTPPVTLTAGTKARLQLAMTLADGETLNREAPNRWALWTGDTAADWPVLGPAHGSLTCVSNIPLTTVTVPTTSVPTATLEVHVALYLCTTDGTCAQRSIVFVQEVRVGSPNEVTERSPTDNGVTERSPTDNGVTETQKCNGLVEEEVMVMLKHQY